MKLQPIAPKIPLFFYSQSKMTGLTGSNQNRY